MTFPVTPEIILAADTAELFYDAMTNILRKATIAAHDGDEAANGEVTAAFNAALDSHLLALATAMGGVDNLLTVIENPMEGRT